ncbi:hypothetical protein WDZ92_50390, partial [Nostoc sp. NIES-2111]
MLAFKRQIFSMYAASLREVFSDMPEIDIHLYEDEYDVFYKDGLELKFDDLPGDDPTTFDFETFEYYLGGGGLSSDYEALGRGFTHNYRETPPNPYSLYAELHNTVESMVLAADGLLPDSGRPSMQQYAHVMAQMSAQLIVEHRGMDFALPASGGVSGDLTLDQPALENVERLVVKARSGTLTNLADRQTVGDFFKEQIPASLGGLTAGPATADRGVAA